MTTRHRVEETTLMQWQNLAWNEKGVKTCNVADEQNRVTDNSIIKRSRARKRIIIYKKKSFAPVSLQYCDFLHVF
jgi:hypothetical protein